MEARKIIKLIDYRVFAAFAAVFLFLLWYGYYLSQQRLKPVVAALMFHSVDKKGPSGSDEEALVITPEKLSEDIKYLKSHGYEFIGQQGLIDLLSKSTKNTNSNNKILLTFDDGYRNIYANAFPILNKELIKAMVNIIVYHAEYPAGAVNGIRLPNRYLLWHHINEMKKSGVIEIGSHSYNSHQYTQLKSKFGPMLSGKRSINGVVENNIQFENRIRDDLLKSAKLILKRTGEYPKVISYPFGGASREAKKIAKEIGFKIQMGIKPGVNSKASDLDNLKRIAVKQKYSPEQLDERIRFYIGTRLLLP